MKVDVTGPYIYYTIPIFGGINITQTTVSLFAVTILLCTAFILLGRNLKKRPGGRQVLVEKGVMMLRDLVVSTMGEHNEKFLPLIGTIFLSSICGSIIGLTGFIRSATADLSVVLTWAVMVSVIIWANNIKHNGFWGWLKGFTEPIVIMTPMNLISEIAQPMAMAFRHFGNIAGGGVISAILYTALSLASTAVLNLIASNGLAVCIVLLAVGVALIVIGLLPPLKSFKYKAAFPIFGGFSIALGAFGALQMFGILSGVPVLAFGVPAVLSLYFDFFSGFVQALVFSMLSMVYIAGSSPPPEEVKSTQ